MHPDSEAATPYQQQLQQQPELAQLRVGLLTPRLWPARYETLFWRSDFFRNLARDKDNWHLFLRICHEALFLFRFCAGAPVAAIGPVYQAMINCAMLTTLQQALRLFFPDIYRRVRWAVIVHGRLYLFLVNWYILKAVRRAALIMPAKVVDAAFMYQVVQGTPNFRILRALLIGSASLWSLIDSLPVRGPFVLDICMPFMYLCTSFRLISPLSAQYFSRPRFTQDTRHFCHTASRFLNPMRLTLPSFSTPLSCGATFLTTLLSLSTNSSPRTTHTQPPGSSSRTRRTPTQPPPTHICDTIQHTWVLVLFLQLYVTFALTTYIILRLERRVKSRFVRHLQDTPQPLPPTAVTQPTSATHCPQTPPLTPPHTPRTSGANSPPPGSALAHPTSTSATLPRSPPPALCRHPRLLSTAAGCLPWISGPRLLLQSNGLRPALQLLRTCCQHLLALWLLAALMWQVAVALHEPLAKYVVPVNFVGAHTEWFWELRCGSPHPCCPASL